jgi:hypothetical protein
MNSIEIEQNSITIAGHEVEIDIRVSGTYSPTYRGARDCYQQIEPDEPASFEVCAVEFRTIKYDAESKQYAPTSGWQSFPEALLLPDHMAAIVEQGLDYHQGRDQYDRECAAEARRAA